MTLETTVNQQQLQEHLSEAAQALEVPGVAVGVYHEGNEHYAFHGVTSIDNPLPVEENTLFQFGSTGKTFTATAMMRLVERGDVDLGKPVRTYLPELKLKDEDVAREVTVLQLFNHTAGWQGDFMESTGYGDDALARYVERMASLEQVMPLGSAVSYNNASLSLAGRVIEKLTGLTFEQGIRQLLLEPLGLEHIFYLAQEIMSHRFAMGHNQHPDGSIKAVRSWGESRGGNPAGANVSSNAGDQIAWARFHMGDGRAPDGTRLLSAELLDLMKKPTFDMPGSALGDAVGISWFLRNVDAVQTVGHGGDTFGQHSEFVMVPERDFAITVLTNCGPNGSQLKEDLVRWGLDTYVGVVDRDPEPVALDTAALKQYTGTYETIAAVCQITAANGGLEINVEIKPDTRKILEKQGTEIPQQPPIRLGLLPGDGDRYIVSDGPAKGMKGYFVRGPSGDIEAVHVGGRLATRTTATT
jgi:CubicO group peptidase (beta-lactamase class C family)